MRPSPRAPKLDAFGWLAPAVLLAAVVACGDRSPAHRAIRLLEAPYVTFSQGTRASLSSPLTLGGEARPCLVAPTPAETRFRLELPPRAFLSFAVGVRPASSREAGPETPLPQKVRFRIRVGENQPSTEVFRRDIHVSRAGRWLDQWVDLHLFSRKEVWLSFETSPVAPNGSVLQGRGSPFVGVFAEPTLHDRARYRQGRGVVLISIDTLRRDHVGVYGYRRQTTPELARLAEQAVVFDDAVSTSSWTLPAHASLLTSLYPSFHGAVNLHRGLAPGLPGLPGLLRQKGFFTQAIVTHLYLSTLYGFGEGFDRHVFLPETRAQAVTDRAIAFLRSHGDQDFFLFLHYYDPHWHYDPPPPYDRVFDPSYTGGATGIWWDFKTTTRESMDPRDLRHIVALYDGEILYTDRQVGRFLREMKRLEMFDRALVVVTSDHGEEFLDHGGWEHQKTLYEEQIRVPLVLKLPESARRATRFGGQVSLLDVAPTVLDVLGFAVPSSFQGRSLLPWLNEANEGAVNTAIWSETEHTVDGSHKLSLRKGVSAPKVIFSLYGGEREHMRVELYDLPRDGKETLDLGGSTPKVVEEGRKRLERFLERVRDWRKSTAVGARPVELSPEQLDKLRALGYAR